MNVLQNLVEFYNGSPLDSTYRQVAKGILENLPSLSDATIYEIAELTNSSRTTIGRMVHKIGYKSFSEFRHALTAAISQFTYYNRMFPSYSTNSESEILNAGISQFEQATHLIKEYVSAQNLLNIAAEINKKRQIYFYLPFRSFSVYSFQQNLFMSGKETGCFSLLPDMLESTKCLSANSIVFASTIEFAETMDLTTLFDKVKSQASTLYLVNGFKSRYRKYADSFLFDSNIQTGSEPSWNLVFEMYILMLSEVYRLNFCK